MANAAEEKWSIDRLDGTNWSTWKFQMKHVLLANELWEWIGGRFTAVGSIANQSAIWAIVKSYWLIHFNLNSDWLMSLLPALFAAWLGSFALELSEASPDARSQAAYMKMAKNLPRMVYYFAQLIFFDWFALDKIGCVWKILMLFR